MKKGMILGLCLSIVAAVFSVINYVSVPELDIKAELTERESKVITVTDSDSFESADKVLNTRFLNMLNRNFVYGDAFDTVEDVVNYSMPALLELRDSEDASYINMGIVSGFVYDMYGIEVDFSLINQDLPQKEGYVYILPRGYEKYSHSIVAVIENEDGSYTVKTNVKISSHDGCVYTDVCETLFVRNEASQFGFNMVYSNIGAPATTI